MKPRIGILVLACAVGACDLDVPDLNNPAADDLVANPDRSKVQAAASGMLVMNRAQYAQANGYISELGILGRESYNLDPADPRFIQELLEAEVLDPGNGAFGGNFWLTPFRNIHGGFNLLRALDVLEPDKNDDVTDAEIEATRGFVKTIQALEFLTLIVTRHDAGAPIDVDRALDEELAPIVGRDEVYAHIAQLLDDAATDLGAGGEAFPFPLPSGFTGFDTPATFLTFNRAIRARVAVYVGSLSGNAADYQVALDALDDSFLSEDPADFGVGVYHSHSTGTGDTTNGLINPNLFAHPSFTADAEMKTGGDPDDRVARKVFTKPPVTTRELTSDLGFAEYTSPGAPAPIIRNEELILIRAEARIFAGELADAIDDINLVRTASGGLDARTDLDADNIVDELLQQRRYSLFFEGGHRWIDMRRYDRLDELPVDVDTHTVHASFPIPESEQNARQ